MMGKKNRYDGDRKKEEGIIRVGRRKDMKKRWGRIGKYDEEGKNIRMRRKGKRNEHKKEKGRILEGGGGKGRGWTVKCKGGKRD